MSQTATHQAVYFLSVNKFYGNNYECGQCTQCVCVCVLNFLVFTLASEEKLYVLLLLPPRKPPGEIRYVLMPSRYYEKCYYFGRLVFTAVVIFHVVYVEQWARPRGISNTKPNPKKKLNEKTTKARK